MKSFPPSDCSEMFLNTVCRSLCRELAVSHTCLSETQFAWFHTLLDNHFIYYSTITAIEALKSTENLYVHNFIRCVWVRDWDSETERQRLKDRGKERKSLHCVPVFLLSIVKCMHGCQLEIVELFFSLLMFLALWGVCMHFLWGIEMLLSYSLSAWWQTWLQLKGGKSGSAALWCFCGLRWTCLKTSISFVPEHKSVTSAHLTTNCFNTKELGHVSFLYFFSYISFPTSLPFPLSQTRPSSLNINIKSYMLNGRSHLGMND